MKYDIYQKFKANLSKLKTEEQILKETSGLEANFLLDYGLTQLIISKTGKYPEETIINRLTNALQVISADSKDDREEAQIRVNYAIKVLRSEL